MNRLLCTISIFVTGFALTHAFALGQTTRPVREPSAGLIYYAKSDYAFSENRDVIDNPYIAGALFQIVWSEVEAENGVCDWSQVDGWIKPWLDAGKGVAIRFMWSTSGNWPAPYYKTPTPKWVWDEGAKFVFYERSKTEIPMIWDPIYKKYAWRFMEQFAARYEDNPNLLFVDVTPGAETNPYRFMRMNRDTPEFKDQFIATPASDGRTYSDEMWLEVVKEWIDAADGIFKKAPLLVTLNVGGMSAADRLGVIGDYCVERGFYVGQNGLNAGSYIDSESGRLRNWHRWSQTTSIFFEMGAGTGGRTGVLQGVMEAAERAHCSYLNVYPEDVLRGTRGQANFSQEYEDALKYGAETLMPANTSSATNGRSR